MGDEAAACAAGGVTLCACHGEPAYWQKDKRKRAGGYWRCAVKKRAANRRGHAKYADVRRVKEQERWYAPGGGYVKWRLRDLSRQRADVLARLAQLDQEATGD